MTDLAQSYSTKSRGAARTRATKHRAVVAQNAISGGYRGPTIDEGASGEAGGHPKTARPWN